MDADGDTWMICEGDCDDGDAGINPGETEIANDGIDQDCDGADLTTGTLPTGNLIAYWPLDTDTDDYSGNGHHGTPANLTTAIGAIGGCYEFDGASSQITVPDDPALDLTGPHTIMLWFLADTVPPVYGYDLITKANHGISTGWMLNYRDTTELRQSWYPTNNMWSNGTVPAGDWHHVAVTYDGTNRTMYIDGSLDGSVTSAATNTNGTDVVIGYHVNGTPEYWFDGLIDEVVIFGEAIDGGDIATYVAAVVAVDGDGDGWSPADGDCDDGDASIYPGATEICDGLADDDCDGDWDGADDDCVVFLDEFDTLDPGWVYSWGRTGNWTVSGGMLQENTQNNPSQGAYIVYQGLDATDYPDYLSIEALVSYDNAPVGYGIALILMTPGSGSNSLSMGINESPAEVVTMTCQGPTTTAPFSTDPGTWYTLRLELDWTTDTMTAYADGAPMTTCSLVGKDVALAPAIGLYLGADNQTAYYDYYKVIGF